MTAQAGRPATDTARVTPPDPLDRGAPTTPLVANPTFWMLALFGALMITSIFGYLFGPVPVWAAIVLGALGRYVGFTVLHESVHRVAHRDRRVNDAMALFPGLALTFLPSVFRTVHLRHHAKTNDPDVDPDHAVSRASRWWRLGWLTSPLWTYRNMMWRHGWYSSRRQRIIQLLLDAGHVGVIVWAIAAGRVVDLVVVGLAPLMLALWFLAWAFDYLPHTPHTRIGRFVDTRAMPSRFLDVVLLGQNYHLVHHVWNTVPFWKYRRVFDERVDELVAAGATVDDPPWRRTS